MVVVAAFVLGVAALLIDAVWTWHHRRQERGACPERAAEPPSRLDIADGAQRSRSNLGVEAGDTNV
jgi:hypothetical protein